MSTEFDQDRRDALLERVERRGRQLRRRRRVGRLALGAITLVVIAGATTAAVLTRGGNSVTQVRSEDSTPASSAPAAAPLVPKCETVATPSSTALKLESALPSGFQLSSESECTDNGTYHQAVFSYVAGGQLRAVWQHLSGPAPTPAEIAHGAAFSTAHFADGSSATEVQVGSASQAVLVTTSDQMLNLSYISLGAPQDGARPSNAPLSAAQLGAIADQAA